MWPIFGCIQDIAPVRLKPAMLQSQWNQKYVLILLELPIYKPMPLDTLPMLKLAMFILIIATAMIVLCLISATTPHQMWHFLEVCIIGTGVIAQCQMEYQVLPIPLTPTPAPALKLWHCKPMAHRAPHRKVIQKLERHT